MDVSILKTFYVTCPSFIFLRLLLSAVAQYSEIIDVRASILDSGKICLSIPQRSGFKWDVPSLVFSEYSVLISPGTKRLERETNHSF
jgi:hypothetical protein